MPTFHDQDLTSPQYEAADIIKQWCLDREDDGVCASAATVEIDTLLTGDRGATSLRVRLEDPQQRSAIRRDVRAHLGWARDQARG